MTTQAAPAVIPTARPTLPQLVGLAVVLLWGLVVGLGTAPWWGGWVREATVPPAQATLYNYNDFAEEIAAASLIPSADRPHLYSISTQLARQQAIWGPRYPTGQPLPFALVPWAAFLLVPFLLVPHAVAFLAFSALSALVAGATFLALARWARLPPVVAATFVLAGLASFPLLRTLQLGQFSALAFAAATGSLLLLWRGADTGAGLALAAATLKPHLFVLLPLALVAERRWRTIAAAVAGVVALIGLSMVVIGPNVVGDYVTLLRDFSFSESVEQMQNWRGLFESTLGLTGPLLTGLMALSLAAMTALVAWVWWPFWTKQPTATNIPHSALRTPHSEDLRWAITIIASLLFSPHFHFNDMLLWAIPAAIILRRLYAPPPGGTFTPRERTVAFILLWLAYIVPTVSFFAQALRPGLWFALLVLALLIARLRGETGDEWLGVGG